MVSKVSVVFKLFDDFKTAFSRNDLAACSSLLSQLKCKMRSLLMFWIALLDPSSRHIRMKPMLEDEERDPTYKYDCDTSTRSKPVLMPFLLKILASFPGYLGHRVLLTEIPSLPPLYCESPAAVHELTLARDIFEHAVVLSLKNEDQDAFERDFLQLKPYYTDTRGFIPPSTQEFPILGLNLLRLLVQNRIAEFHTELELLSPEALDNVCIRHAVELEQSFMEGAYNRVLSARQAVPHETYVYFMDLLAKTVRDEIAGCSEKAFDYLSLQHAKQILMFSSDWELEEYVREEHPEWEMRSGCLYFQKVKESAPCKEIPSLQLINQTLGYARELERIV